jgi:hypothetical protein
MIGNLGESAPRDVSEASFPNIPMSKFIQVQGDHSVILLGGQVSRPNGDFNGRRSVTKPMNVSTVATLTSRLARNTISQSPLQSRKSRKSRLA